MNNGPTKLKKGRKGKSSQTSGPTSEVEGSSKAAAKTDWGLFEPARPILGPLVDTIKPILTGNVVYGLLVGLLVATWFGFGSYSRASGPYGRELAFLSYPDRLAAYEEMWRREESELWEWLEERIGLDGLDSTKLHNRKRTVDPRAIQDRLREEKMSEREIKEAISVTEEKLKVLRSVIDKSTKP
jgi:hypothetical protein